MSALPSLSATLPAPVHTALVMTAVFIPSADTCLSIASGILHEMREAAAPDDDEPVDSATVAGWQERLEWLLGHLEADLDRLREDVKASGVRGSQQL